MRILAHRGNMRGPQSNDENGLGALRRCLARGWGVETDLRSSRQGVHYVSHDPAPVTARNRAEPFFALFRDYPRATLALNIKNPGSPEVLVAFLAAQKLPAKTFLFDLDLHRRWRRHPAAALRRLDPTLRVAVRVSDRSEPLERALEIPEAEVAWLDEFDRLWAQESDVKRLKAAGKEVYVVSPELHGFPREDMIERWAHFRAWGVDGICTDYAALLERVLRRS